MMTFADKQLYFRWRDHVRTPIYNSVLMNSQPEILCKQIIVKIAVKFRWHLEQQYCNTMNTQYYNIFSADQIFIFFTHRHPWRWRRPGSRCRTSSRCPGPWGRCTSRWRRRTRNILSAEMLRLLHPRLVIGLRYYLVSNSNLKFLPQLESGEC